MEMKQISETTLKITISMEDLEERGMELKDFLIPQEKTEEFFYSVMDELDLPDNFKDSGMLSFRVTPRKDRIDVFVTKSEINKDINFEDLAAFDDVSNMSPEEFFKTLEQTMLSKGDTEAHEKLGKIEEMMEGAVEDVNPSDYVHYVLDFPSLEATVAFAKAIDFPVEASELYKMDGAYYMTVLIDLQNHPSYYANLMYARMLEYAGAGTKTRAYLQEHAVELLTDDAVEKLKMIELV
ncbi:negative regulator of competence [Streptococcus infantarius subsp. infantarius]|uniref:Adapter protein MecA n=2 Tax=Streptococcus infantarius TaxID=102684 RepID=A0A380KMR6_9STRE|nr:MULTISPECIES: adaptor protein MecA [Streptococcus]AEZ61659.1 negative regulator of competence [Streptococcus infantarius subsp. infantarius CJ18]EDT48687.1 negative regulator of genetic competence (MecA) [Streptococcus infantarius subsp. infantarius ATCC BAA-102]MBK8155621.1 adaptor protein MecA [Streptococcus sp.]MBT0896921.1 adaptor protein MecA [Streptococcus infantarius subsp. infantarius]MBT0900812.1 adaptor protein MecA [Streptococcus infantarius subsp. infantarius]